MKKFSLIAMFGISVVVLLPMGSGCGARHAVVERNSSPRPTAMVATLNALRDDISARYGFREGAPRVNLGPCGRVARDFRDRWNARFRDPVSIAFIMSGNTPECFHVLVKLPDGRYFDGGNGVVTGSFLATLYPGSHIDVMKTFDYKLLDERSYGLERSYPECTNYSDAFTREAIDRRLGELAKEP